MTVCDSVGVSFCVVDCLCDGLGIRVGVWDCDGPGDWLDVDWMFESRIDLKFDLVLIGCLSGRRGGCLSVGLCG